MENQLIIAPIDISNVATAQRDAEQMAAAWDAVKVTTQDEYSVAGASLKKVKTYLKQIDERRKEMTRPLDESKRSIMDMFIKPINALETLAAKINREMVAYQQQVEAERRRQEEEARKAREAAEAEARAAREAELARLRAVGAEAKASGLDFLTESAQDEIAAVESAPVVVAPPPIVDAPKPKAAGTSYRTKYSIRIVDVNLIPRCYMIPDEGMIRRTLADGKGAVTIPGVELVEEKYIAG